MDTRLIAKAEKISLKVHGNQKDKKCYPYMAHIHDVALRVSHLGESYEIVGLLHDAIEDAEPKGFKEEIVLEIKQGFDDEIFQAITAM